MTLEEQIEKLKADNEALASKNADIIGELRTARNKNKEVDVDAYHKALDSVDNLTAEVNKLNGVLKLKDKDIEKLSVSYQEANGKLEHLSYEDAINKALEGLPLGANMQSKAKKMLKADAQFKDGVLSFGDKSQEDFLKEWTGPEGDGYIFLAGKEHSGGGATGGNGNTAPSTKKRSEMTDSEKAAYITEHGQDAYFKL